MSVKDLLRDPDFAAKLADAGNLDAAAAMFAERGVTVTPDELMRLTIPDGDELTEDDLETVAGGSARIDPFIGWVKRRRFERAGGSRS